MRALDQLIQKVTTALILACPDPEQQFFLEVDVSSFALGAVLFQKEELGWHWDVAYFSKVLLATEQNCQGHSVPFSIGVVASGTLAQVLPKREGVS